MKCSLSNIVVHGFKTKNSNIFYTTHHQNAIAYATLSD